jgi:hypothetical protein
MQENITASNLLAQEHSALAAEITDIVNDNLPREKAIAAQQILKTAKEIQSGLAPTSGDGRGQAAGSIPMIVYLRWQLEYPGCWQDKSFVTEFLYDNPGLVFPGYKPKPKRQFLNMRHGNIKLNNFGGDLYLERRAKVQQAIQAQRNEQAKNS